MKERLKRVALASVVGIVVLGVSFEVPEHQPHYTFSAIQNLGTIGNLITAVFIAVLALGLDPPNSNGSP